MLILGLESSCDETAAAVVEDGRAVRSNVVASQHELHAEYGGVVPEVASRAHLERLTPVVEAALRDAGVGFGELDAVAVGNRPGLIGSLVVGVSAAKALAWSLGVPLIGVDHVEAHLYAPLLDTELAEREVYPALGLVISGGHTSLYRVDSPTALVRLGATIDDAVGEAYDKAAVMLDAGYPGGPSLDRLAQTGDPTAHDLPRPMLGKASLDFSFSGLKTALLYKVRGKPVGRGAESRFEQSAADLNESERTDLAASFQAAVMDTVERKLQRALMGLQEEGVQIKTLLAGGGVTANSELRRRLPAFGERHGLRVGVPPMAYCVDNAAMIAGLASHRLHSGETDGLDLPVFSTTRE
ncbi:MAG: tRNA (adenosine(37)-N6)-threonylcarbamoyltransferase complex transferase subunit TsaD [Planctomycetota bacterium]